MEAVVILLLTVGGVIVLALLGAQVQDRRTRLMRQAAEALDFGFREKDPALAETLNERRLFGQGKAVTARNVVHGSAVAPEVLLCDYHYTHTYSLGPGREASQHLRQSVLVLIDREEDWPAFCLRPRRPQHRFTGTGEVRFEDDPAFDKACLVQADNETAVRELFNVDVRHEFAQELKVSVEAGGPYLIIAAGKMISPEEVRVLLAEGFRVMNVLKTGGQRS